MQRKCKALYNSTRVTSQWTKLVAPRKEHIISLLLYGVLFNVMAQLGGWMEYMYLDNQNKYFYRTLVD